MEDTRNNQKQPEQELIEIGRFRPEDAKGIVSLFHAVYGEGYPIRLFYDPAAITAANDEGQYISIVARTKTGEVIGVAHLYRSAPYPNLYEWGVGLVSKDCRNMGINKRLADYLHFEYIPTNQSIETVFGEGVCNHLHAQKALKLLGYVETAIEVALMPAAAYTREKSAPGRVATLTCSLNLKPKPITAYSPRAYEEILKLIYGRLNNQSDVVISSAALPANAMTEATMTVFDFANVARIMVPRLGSDFAERFLELEEQARRNNVVVFQVWLNLTEPGNGQAADILREQGYFFGGIQPRWFDGDGLLMQKLDCLPDFENIMLLPGFSEELLQFIRQDWESVRRP